MALSGADLAAARKAKLESAFGTAMDPATFDAFLLKDSEAIVEYLTANNTVTVDVSGVTPGPATVSGTGAFT